MGADTDTAVTTEFMKEMMLELFVAAAAEIRFCLKETVKFELESWLVMTVVFGATVEFAYWMM